MAPTYIIKSLTLASSRGVAIISSNQSSASTINSSNLGTARRISYFSSVSADNSAVLFTLTGTNQGGAIISEVIRGSTATALVQTSQDFLTVTSVVASCTVNAIANFGTSSLGGTPWYVVDTTRNPMAIAAGITFSTSANSMSAVFDVTLDDVTRTFPNPSLSVPSVFNSTSGLGVAVSTNSWGLINNGNGNITAPIAAWRLTITSSSSGSGSISATVIQSGIS